MVWLQLTLLFVGVIALRGEVGSLSDAAQHADLHFVWPIMTLMHRLSYLTIFLTH